MANVPAVPTALLIADAPWVSNDVRAALSIGSWHVEEINDPHAVGERLEKSRVDAIIVDMQVNAMGGMAIIRAIRQETDPMTRPRLILLLDRSADEFLAKRAGADAAVLKPFEPPALRAALDPALVAPLAEEE